MAAQIASQSPVFVLGGGDQIHGIMAGECNIPLPTQYSDWKAAMAPILSITYPVRGNHETYGDVTTPGADYAKNWMTYMVGNMPEIWQKIDFPPKFTLSCPR